MLFLTYLTACVSLVLACSPEGQESMPRENDLVGKTYFSHAVVIGRVITVIPTPNLGNNAYTVSLQLDCVVKDVYGIIQDRVLNITEAGVIEGMCHSAIFQPSYSYVAFLRRDHSGLYKPWASPAMSDQNNKNDVMKTCALKPTGSQCPAPPRGECEPDVNDYSHGQDGHSHDGHGHDDLHKHEDDHGAEHHADHMHHSDEDLGLGHDHSDHHDGMTDFDHDHDHSDHHHDDHDHGHEHHGDEDKDYSHDHHEHHENGDFEHDHDHDAHHDADAAAGSGHRDVMTAASVFVVLVLSLL